MASSITLDQLRTSPEDRIYQLFPQRFDMKKVMALSDDDFAHHHLLLMQEYREKNGWWSEGQMPLCDNCREIIPGPEQLRRYKGGTLDAGCFREVWASEPYLGGPGNPPKAYFDRIANLKHSQPVTH